MYDSDTGVIDATDALDSSGDITASITETYDDFGDELTYTDASGDTTGSASSLYVRYVYLAASAGGTAGL